MAKYKNLRRNQGGFVIIVALGMILLLSIFAVIISQTTLNTLRSMKEGMNVFTARIFADSGIEYLRYFVTAADGSGMNSGKILCNYGSYSTVTTAANAGTSGTDGGEDFGNPDLCEPFDNMVALMNKGGKSSDLKIVAEIKGRAGDGSNDTPEENFTSGCSGISGSSCYVVPFPGTGTAGKNCEMYKPVFPSKGDDKINVKNGKPVSVDNTSENSADEIKQIEYSCNWNKLTFGSSTTDRATIPLYYTEDDGDKTVSPFSNDPAIGGSTVVNSFVVRVRTPCKPVTDLATKKTETPVDCADADRYILEEDDGDDIVVQWQITGLCKKTASSTEYEEECGMIQFSKYVATDSGTGVDKYFSAINEGRINFQTPDLYNDSGGTDDSAHKLLYPILNAIDTSTYTDVHLGAKSSTTSKKLVKLPTMKNPTLSLFLSNKLISDDGGRVPYLEYQVLTSTPVSDSKIKMEVTVTFNGNTYKKTIYKEEQKPLIDFAIQN